MAVTENGSTLNTENTIGELIPEKTYREKFVLPALLALANLEDNPVDLVKCLFSKDEITWLKQRISH